MLADTNERAGLDEQYIAATNASDLTMHPDHRGAVDHLIASALGSNRMADALNYLRGEWDGAEKPAKWTEADVLAHADTLPKKKGRPDVRMARTQMIVAYSRAMRAAYTRLAGRALCLEILREWAARRGVDADLLSPALYHWLHPVCPVCDGLKKIRHQDAPVLGKDCHHCAGTGKWPRPPGGDRIESFLKGCVGKARQDRGYLLYGDG